MSKRIVIIGGVAGGASAAARMRRLSESAEIHLIERGQHVSFANCGLPYHIGGEIADRSKLLLHTPDSLKARFGLNVHIRTEATAIEREARRVKLRKADGRQTFLDYDELVLAPGAAPIRPALPGIEGGGVYSLRDISDMDSIIKGLSSLESAQRSKSVIVVGGGYIGVELAEQLVQRAFTVTLVEGAAQILSPFDPEMAGILEHRLRQSMQLVIGSRLEAILRDEKGAVRGVKLENGSELKADIVLLGLGVRPEIALARQSGLKIGELGGILVNDYLQTSDQHIWAVGDAIEVTNIITKKPALIPLAGPANRQGRLVADNIFLSQKKRYRGTLGTAVIRVHELIAACTGANERTLRQAGLQYEKLYLFPNNHAGYFPGASSLSMKVLFCPHSRKLLGAQVIGQEGADKRIDVFATAILAGLSVDDLSELELCYAPPVGSAKDPVNMAGMMMKNVCDGLVRSVAPNKLRGVVLDVRSSAEFSKAAFPGAIHIALDELRGRLAELPRDQTISVYCQTGQRSYNATRILMQHGFDALNVTGAWRAMQLFEKST